MTNDERIDALRDRIQRLMKSRDDALRQVSYLDGRIANELREFMRLVEASAPPRETT